LLGDWASNDPENGTTEVALIGTDLTVHLLDSVSTYKLGREGERLDSTRQLTVTDELYKILDNGDISRVR